jgi:hypothetical protein
VSGTITAWPQEFQIVPDTILSEPSGAAKALLKVTVAAPKTVRKVLAAA